MARPCPQRQEPCQGSVQQVLRAVVPSSAVKWRNLLLSKGQAVSSICFLFQAAPTMRSQGCMEEENLSLNSRALQEHVRASPALLPQHQQPPAAKNQHVKPRAGRQGEWQQ